MSDAVSSNPNVGINSATRLFLARRAHGSTAVPMMGWRKEAFASLPGEPTPAAYSAWPRKFVGLAMLSLMGLLAGCASTRTADGWPSLADWRSPALPQANHSDGSHPTAEVTPASALAEPQDAVSPLHHTATAQPVRTTASHPPAVIPASHLRPGSQAADSGSTTPEYSPLASRCPPCSGAQDGGGCQVPGHPVYHRHAQEYVFDGGDLDPSVAVRKDWSAAGVNSTDTVAYYQTPGGKVCVQPSNRVGIYAPRFGAVRQVTGAVTADGALATNRVYAPVRANGLEEYSALGQLNYHTSPIGRKQIQQLDRFQEERVGVPLEAVTPPLPISDAVSALINVDLATTDRAMSRDASAVSQKTVVIESIYNPESIELILAGQPAVWVSNNQRSADVHVYETPDRCAIRLTKSSSHTLANPGDIVRFTIRFENISPGRLEKLVVIDSLSSRLGYIEASQHSSVGARFSIEMNEVGSSLLRWEFDSAIDRHEGGVISFDCLVH